LSAYGDSYFVFDFRIIDYGFSDLGLFLNFQCGWPCRSQYFPLANTNDVNLIAAPAFPLIAEPGEWYEARVPVDYFLKDNFSLSDPQMNLAMLDSISISTPWASSIAQQGFHFQLDNVRFERSDLSLASSEPVNNFILSASSLTYSAFSSETLPTLPEQIFSASLKELGDELYIFVDASAADFIVDSYVNVNPDILAADIGLVFEDPENIIIGIHSAVVEVRACHDQNCNQQYRGSPQKIRVNYIVN
jgi:hypothetical protein